MRISDTSSGPKRPCSTTPGVGREPGRELGRVVDRPEVVGDQAAVRAGRHLAELGRGDRGRGSRRRRRRGSPTGSAAEIASTTLSDEAMTTKRVRGGCNDLLPRVRRPASLDEPAVGSDLVGSVDGEVEALECVEGLDRRARARSPRVPSGATWRRSGSPGRAAPSAARKWSTVEPVPSPTRMPSSTSKAAASAARRFSSSALTRSA